MDNTAYTPPIKTNVIIRIPFPPCPSLIITLTPSPSFNISLFVGAFVRIVLDVALIEIYLHKVEQSFLYLFLRSRPLRCRHMCCQSRGRS